VAFFFVTTNHDPLSLLRQFGHSLVSDEGGNPHYHRFFTLFVRVAFFVLAVFVIPDAGGISWYHVLNTIPKF
jgi:hypothetical protein